MFVLRVEDVLFNRLYLDYEGNLGEGCVVLDGARGAHFLQLATLHCFRRRLTLQRGDGFNDNVREEG